MSHSCPSKLILSALLSDQLDAGDTDLITRHVESCARCQQTLDELTRNHDVSPFYEAWRRREGLEAVRSAAAEQSRSTSTSQHQASNMPTQLGRFQIKQRLGGGSFGVVYLAWDSLLKRNVALKIPHDSALVDEDLRARFLREAEATAKLNHPNIVPLHDAGEHEGVCYLAAEYCSGGNLVAWRARHPGPISYRQAAHIVAALADAVDHAHRQGVLHRDIKPSNILVEPAADPSEAPFIPRLTDFGLARLAGSDAARTMRGVVVGTPQYMAPEQADPSFGPIAAPTDVYALGVVLFELIAGRRPIDDDDQSRMLHQLVKQQPLGLRRLQPGAPRDLEAICDKCLRKRPDERYRSAAALRDDLRRLLSNQATIARPDSFLRALARSARRYPARAGFALTTVALVLVIVVSLVFRSSTLEQMNLHLAALLEEQKTLRYQAEQSEASAKRLLYVANIQLVAEAVQDNDPAQAAALLSQYLPAAGEPDLRGFEWFYLLGRAARDHQSLARHDGAAYMVAVSPDGRWFATAGADAVVRVFDRFKSAAVSEISSEQGEVNGLAFSSDGRILVTAGDDGSVVLWDWKQRKRQRTITATAGLAYQVLFSRENQQLITCGDDPEVRIWQVDSGELISTLRGHERAVEAIALSQNGETLVTASSDETVGVWDMVRRELAVRYTGHVNRVLCVSMMPGDQYVATGSIDQTMQIWRLDNGELLQRIELPDAVQAVQFSADGKWLFAGDRAGSVHRFRAVNREGTGLPRSYERDSSWSAHDGRTYAVASAGNSSVITAGDDGHVRIWRNAAGPAIRVLQADQWLPIHGFCFGARSDEIVVCGERGTVSWNLVTDQRFLWDDDVRPDMRIARSTGGRLIAVADAAGKVVVWNGLERKRVAAWNAGATVELLAFTPQDDRLALVLGDRRDRIAIYESRTGELVTHVSPGPEKIDALGCHPAHLRFAASFQNDVFLLDAANKEALTMPPHHSSTISEIAFSQQGDLIATASNDRSIGLWDQTTGRHLGSLTGHRAAVEAIAMSPTGSRLASADQRGVVKLWDLETRQHLCDCELDSPGARVERVAFSADGQHLACLHAAGLSVLSAAAESPNNSASPHVRVARTAAETSHKTRGGFRTSSPRFQGRVME